MKEIAATIFALALGCAVAWGESPATNAVPEGVKHPTRAGTYVMGEWTYVYGVKGKGSQSERRNGALFRQGFPFPGRIGEVMDTPFGRFVFLDESYDSGWLKTATYDRPLFDEKGDLFPDIRKRLDELRRQKEEKLPQNQPSDRTR